MTSDPEEIKVLLLLPWQLNYHISETSGPSLLPLVIAIPDWTQYNFKMKMNHCKDTSKVLQKCSMDWTTL